MEWSVMKINFDLNLHAWMIWTGKKCRKFTLSSIKTTLLLVTWRKNLICTSLKNQFRIYLFICFYFLCYGYHFHWYLTKILVPPGEWNSFGLCITTIPAKKSKRNFPFCIRGYISVLVKWLSSFDCIKFCDLIYR